jgi:hypothetical protein
VQIVPPANPGSGDDDPGGGGSGDGGGWSTDMRLGIVVGGLVGVAALVGAITFFYWRRTRPQPYLTALDALAEIDRGGLDGPRPANGVAGANGLLHTPPRGTTTADVLSGGAAGASTGIVGPAPLTPRPPLGPPASVRVIGADGATGTGQPNPAGPAAAPAPGPLRLPPVGAEPTSAPAAPATPKLKLPEPGEVRPLIDPPTAPLVTLEDLQRGPTPPADDA